MELTPKRDPPKLAPTKSLTEICKEQGLFPCPHCLGRDVIMVFATFKDLRTHVKRGCKHYSKSLRYTRGYPR